MPRYSNVAEQPEMQVKLPYTVKDGRGELGRDERIAVSSQKGLAVSVRAGGLAL